MDRACLAADQSPYHNDAQAHRPVAACSGRKDRWPAGAAAAPTAAAGALGPRRRSAAGADADAPPRHCVDPGYTNSRSTNSCYGSVCVAAAASHSRTPRLTVLGLILAKRSPKFISFFLFSSFPSATIILLFIYLLLFRFRLYFFYRLRSSLITLMHSFFTLRTRERYHHSDNFSSHGHDTVHKYYTYFLYILYLYLLYILLYIYVCIYIYHTALLRIT